MSALDALPVVLAEDTFLHPPCGRDEIVRERETSHLTAQSTGESPTLLIGPATGDLRPPGHDRLLDSHHASEVRNEVLIGDAGHERDVGLRSPLTASISAAGICASGQTSTKGLSTQSRTMSHV